jgi:uncharacterized protein
VKSAKRFRLWCYLTVAILALGASSGCGEHKSVAPAADAKSPNSYFAIKLGDQTVQLQIAALPDEQMHGLMFRRDLGADQGMIFVFPRGQRQAFYMRNTPTPLDIGYFDGDGVLKEIYPMYPFDETSITSRSDRIQFCVEMNQGWYQKAGVKPGAKLDMQALVAALKARGIDPIEYGLRRFVDEKR